MQKELQTSITVSFSDEKLLEMNSLVSSEYQIDK